MAPQAVIVLLIVIALPVVWLASEFGDRRALRITLGIAAIVSAMGVAYLVGHLSRWNYNAWYGGASKDLVDTTVTQIHELTLKNKYEATHVWYDMTNSRVWQTDTLHKLRRATPEQRAFTQQNK